MVRTIKERLDGARDVPQPGDAGCSGADAASRRAEWLAENWEAIEVYNERVERNGLTLAAYRAF
jgi:post-segregation antitoxin (ccd killing protein)